MVQAREFTFAGSSGRLSGKLSMPSGDVRATAIFAHCFTCSAEIPAAQRISQALAARGIAVLSFDFTGLGHSEGEFANTNFSSNVADLVAAARALSDEVAPPALLVGHSLGGAAVIKAAAELDSVVAVATLGAPSDPAHVGNLFGSDLETILAEGHAEVDLGGRPFTITRQFVEDIEANSLTGALLTMNAALLVMHAPSDNIVNISHAGEIFQRALHPKSFVALAGADHLLKKLKDAQYAASVIVAWAEHYLPAPTLTVSAEAPDGAVIVSEISPDGFGQNVLVGGKHALIADEPLDVGGTDRGPTPYGFVAIGLGACTSMTLRLYARRKKIALTGLSVTVTHDKRHVAQCESCEKTEGPVDHFHRVISLGGSFSDAERASLLSIADKCPVHRTLERSSHISTEIVSA